MELIRTRPHRGTITIRTSIQTATIRTAAVMASVTPRQGSRFDWAANGRRQESKITGQVSSTSLVEQIRRAIGESA